MLKIENQRNQPVVQLGCNGLAAAHKVHRRLNKTIQPGLWVKVSCTHLNIVGVTSLHTSHAMTNSKGSRLCAVDGWIANRCEYIGSLFSLISGQLCSVFHYGSENRTMTSVPCCSDCRAPERTILSISSTPV